MITGWQTKPFEDCIEKVTYTSKIQRKDFLDDGAYPIISQEADFINGYWDTESDLFPVTTPIVVFGDHTKVLKYVDFEFVLGADGVKVLPPRSFLLPKFFFYQLQTANLDSLGYARHYKLLKELEITYLFHLLLSAPFTDYAIQGSARAGMPKVNREHLFEFRVWLPGLGKQEELSAKLDALHDETQRLASLYQRKLAALDELKKSLLHQAFSGQL